MKRKLLTIAGITILLLSISFVSFAVINKKSAILSVEKLEQCEIDYCSSCNDLVCSEHYCGYTLNCDICGSEFTCPHAKANHGQCNINCKHID